jgi:uncharacterized protein (UPF0262 family)
LSGYATRFETEAVLSDILGSNYFTLKGQSCRDYHLILTEMKQSFQFLVKDNKGRALIEHRMRPIRNIKDYVTIVLSYRKAISDQKLRGHEYFERVTATGRARAAAHDEAAEVLLKRLKKGGMITDLETARRFVKLFASFQSSDYC